MVYSKHPKEEIQYILISEIHSFPDHPFDVRDDDSMKETANSVRENGVLSPILVRPREEGGFELISGHRRKMACELAGVESIPAIVRNVDRDTAIIMMVDSNLQRESISPMEKARAYKMKNDAIKRQGKRSDLTCYQVGNKLEKNKKTIQKIAEDAGESQTQVHRFIRLNELTPDFQKMVDEGKIGLTTAVEISYLKPDEQDLLADTIDSEQAIPSLSQAQQMRSLSKAKQLNDDRMLNIMMKQKKPETRNVVLTDKMLKKYFPQSYTPKKIEETIIRLLDSWQKKLQQSQNRG